MQIDLFAQIMAPDPALKKPLKTKQYNFHEILQMNFKMLNKL